MRFSKTFRQFAKTLIIAVTIFGGVLGYMPMPNMAQQAQPPSAPKVVSQEPINAEEFLKIVNEDPEMLDTYKFAQGLGFTKFIAAQRVTFNDGTIQVIGEMASKDKATLEESAWLMHYSLKEGKKSLLQQLDKKTVILFDKANSTKIVIDQEKVTIFDLQGNILKQVPLKKSQSFSWQWFSPLEVYGKHVDGAHCPGTFQDGYNACLTTLTALVVYAGYVAAWVAMAAALAACAIPPFVLCAAVPVVGAALIAAQIALDALLIGCQAEALDDLKLPELSAAIAVNPNLYNKGSGGHVDITAIFANVAPADHHTATADFKVTGTSPLGVLYGPTSLTLPAGGGSETWPKTLTNQDLDALTQGRYQIVAEADTSNAVCELNENKGAKVGSRPAPGSDPDNRATGFFDVVAGRLDVIPPLGFQVMSEGSVTLVAGLTDGSNPVSGLPINWSVSEGSLSHASCTTDSSGQCSVTYTAPHVSHKDAPTGKPVTVTVSSPGGNFYPPAGPRTTIGIVIPVRDKSILVAPEIVECKPNVECKQGDTVPLPVQLLYLGVGPPQARVIPGAKIQWTVNPSAVGHVDPTECITGGDGKCSVTYHHDAVSPMMSFTVKASFSGDQDYEPSEKTVQGKGALILQPPLPDLIVSGLFVTVKSRLEAGRLVCDVIGTAMVRNIGTGDAGSFTTGVFLDGRSFPETEQDFTELKAGTAAGVSFLLIGVPGGRHVIEVVADWKNAVKESDENNNKASRTVNCGE